MSEKSNEKDWNCEVNIDVLLDGLHARAWARVCTHFDVMHTLLLFLSSLTQAIYITMLDWVYACMYLYLCNFECAPVFVTFEFQWTNRNNINEKKNLTDTD